MADESAENGWLSPELAIGIRRVKGVKLLGRKIGNWLTPEQAQELVDASAKGTLRGCRDAAILALLLGCGLRCSGSRWFEAGPVAITRGALCHCQFGRQGRANTNGTRADLVQGACRLPGSQVGCDRWKRFRRVLKNGVAQDSSVTANVVWYAVKRCAKSAGIGNLAPQDLRRSCARLCHGCGGEVEQIQFLLGHASVQTTERYIGCKQKLQDAVNDRFGISVARATV